MKAILFGAALAVIATQACAMERCVAVFKHPSHPVGNPDYTTAPGEKLRITSYEIVDGARQFAGHGTSPYYATDLRLISPCTFKRLSATEWDVR